MGWAAIYQVAETLWAMPYEGLSKRQNSDPVTQTLQVGPAITTREQLGDAKRKHEEEVATHIAEDENAPGNPTGKRIFLMRHCERLDRVYPEWARLCFSTGRYQQLDLNMPVNVPKRKAEHFKTDSPITEVGYISGQMIGRACVLAKIQLGAIYCSPTLRCLQSSHALGKGHGQAVPIKIEPAIHECMIHYKKAPDFITPEEMSASSAGIKLDSSYKPCMERKELKEWGKEKADDFFERIKKAATHIIADAPDTCLIMAHADVVDCMSRVLRGKRKYAGSLKKAHLERMGLAYPYACVVGLEQLDTGNWRTIHEPIPPLSFTGYTNIIDFQFYNRAE